MSDRESPMIGTAKNAPSTPDLIAECDRICGVNSKYHKDRCPLYKANCAAMDTWNRERR